jgi:hypothetical protein
MKNFKEVMYYWTSAAIFDLNERKNAFWCTTNATSDIPLQEHQGSAERPQCVAFERWTGLFRPVNCSKKLSFVCEVILKCVSLIFI